MFGNITGGGTLSSKTNYNPTPYVDVILKDFTKLSSTLNVDIEIEKNEQPMIFISFKKEDELDILFS